MTQTSEFLPPPQFPLAPESISSPALRQDFSTMLGKNPNDSPMYRHWILTFNAANQQQTIYTDGGYPDYWYVYVITSWDGVGNKYVPTAVGIYQAGMAQSGSTSAEPEVILTGGGTCRIPATNEYLTIVSRVVGASVCYVGVLALRKSDIDVLVEPGTGMP